MASFIQTSANACAANAEKRPLYGITRSEATWLVRTYKTALERGVEIDMEPFRLFRDALENKKPVYLVKFNDSRNAASQASFYAMTAHFFTVLKKLFAKADDLEHHRKIKALCKELPTTYANAYSTISYLNWSVYNWFYRNEKNITEDLSDNGYETNSCAVCDFTGETNFYFSTAYGLEKPICESCLPIDQTDYEKKDEDYVEEEEVSETESSEAESSEAESSEAEDDEVSDEDDDSDYVPSEDEEESDSDEEEDGVEGAEPFDEDGVEGAEPLDEEESEDDSDASSNYTEETDMEDGVEGTEPLYREQPSLSLPTTPEPDDDEEEDKFFGCEGCHYEWRAGFKYGWQKAMKHMREYADQQKRDTPAAPECASCGDSREDLQKCGRCKIVRYCSEKCQTDDWQQHKQVCRR
jgi:hypothetical protein